MAETNGNSQFGRKVFFLNPSFLIRTNIIEPLKQKEYEVYEIADYHRAGDYLSAHEDAIIYLNIGSQSSATVWLNFIDELKKEHSATTIGVLADQLTANLSQQLGYCNAIQGGVFELGQDFEKVLSQLTNMLDSLEAKGRRQYVRASCMHDSSANFMWFFRDKLFKTRLLDISTASAAILVDSDKMQYLDTTASMPCTLQIGMNQVRVQVKPLVVKQQNERMHCIIYLLNRASLDAEAIAIIRKYVFDTLKAQLQQQAEVYRQKQLYLRRMELARKQNMK